MVFQLAHTLALRWIRSNASPAKDSSETVTSITKADYKGQITFFSWETYVDLCRRFGVTDKHPGVFRRNIITRGVDLNLWIGKEFEIQGVLFEGTQESAPCSWMNQAFCQGAEAAMKGRGGLRARILTDGLLKVDEP